MKRYSCLCGNRLFYGNTRCLSCRRALGFIPERRLLAALEPAAAGRWIAPELDTEALWRDCANNQAARCNWLLPDASPERFCLSCRLSEKIPDLSRSQNRAYWQRLEAAKRYLIVDLVRLGLPLTDWKTDPEQGLRFHFLADEQTAEGLRPVLTGHDTGRITVNVVEADDVHRERVRISLGEAYRTLLGHMRHECGHYYWFRLVSGSDWLVPFRSLFGDERADYQQAVSRHYEHGPNPDWQSAHISPYASAHPWEDWAETWAHYLHITDALETAAGFGLTDLPGESASLGDLLSQWGELAMALNALARSLGLADPYPFVLARPVAHKLELVHDLVCSSEGSPGA